MKLDWREGNNRLLDLGAAASLLAQEGRFLGLAISPASSVLARVLLRRGRRDRQALQRVALTDAFVIAYDSRPPDGIKRLDMQLRSGLLLTL